MFIVVVVAVVVVVIIIIILFITQSGNFWIHLRTLHHRSLLSLMEVIFSPHSTLHNICSYNSIPKDVILNNKSKGKQHNTEDVINLEIK
jgi:hypothetical protein